MTSSTTYRRGKGRARVADSQPRLDATDEVIEILELQRAGLRLGVMGPDGGPAPDYVPRAGETDPGVSLATLVGWHEYGLVPNAPARPILRQWTFMHRREIAQALTDIAGARYASERAGIARGWGRRLQASLRAHFRDGLIGIPLAPSTIERLGYDRAPLASDQILAALRWSWDPSAR